MKQKLKIEWKQRLETLAVAAYLFAAFGLNQLVWTLMVYLCLYSQLGLCLVFSYLGWIYWDRRTNENGGRRWQWFRECAWWRYHRSYFPISLHKTADLPADRNYLLAVVPHGVLSAGAYSAFGTDANNFTSLYPGLVPFLCTLRIMFFLPVVRELMLISGLISPSQRSLNWVLGSPGNGRACVLVVGGATEALHNQPGVYKTMLNHRKGFCRIALNHGVPLVPVVVFGEVDLYEVKSTEPNTWQHRLQMWIKTVTGIMPVKFVGEGWFNLFPKRSPIDIVVGSPIEVEKNIEATEVDVNHLHEKFSKCLVNLFNTQKPLYLKNTDTELLFV